MNSIIFVLFASFLFSAKQDGPVTSIERLDPALDAILNSRAKVEVIVRGCRWTEGPVWLKDQQMLIFSDVPADTIYQWTAKKGKQIYLTPSGHTGKLDRGGEKGSNGLMLSASGKLIVCQDGDRQLSWLDADLAKPKPVYRLIANQYQYRKFNSPNDLVERSNGDIYFTDPPYGLEKGMEDPLKEIPYQGVYKITKSGEVRLELDSISRPNGIALTPDGKTLLIANSDGDKPYWYAYDINEKDALVNGRIFYDCSAAYQQKGGAPDGMKMDSQGHLFATGPGGVWIFDKNAKVLGKINISGRVANCALSNDERVLFITAESYVLRIRMR